MDLKEYASRGKLSVKEKQKAFYQRQQKKGVKKLGIIFVGSVTHGI